jgi:hypothetical protein
MSMLLTGFHPSFDALSAHADRFDIDGSRTRVGHHVARCAGCAQVVEEIRGLGEEARAIELPGAPADLWSRIHSVATEGQAHREAPATRERDEAVLREAPSLKRTRTYPVLRRRRRALAGLGLAAVAGAMITVLLWPRSSGLQAAGTSRLTFTPGRPVPGGTMVVRYEPAPWLKGASHLILIGTFARPAGHNVEVLGSVFAELGDSLATLRPTTDGAFEGRVVIPADFLAVKFGVVDSTGEGRDLDGAKPWLAIGGTPAHGPSLQALLAAVEIHPRFYASAEPESPRQGVVIADSLRKYFPDHPSGWAYTRTYGREQGRFDLIRFFQNAQHRYSAVDAELWNKTNLDAERLHDMVVFANNISEPGEVMKWAGRLAHEHPEDQRALEDLAGALHEIELREPSHLADSIRPWLPVLDRAYVASGTPIQSYSSVFSLADAYGDSATKRLWRHRAMSSQMRAGFLYMGRASAGWEQESQQSLEVMTRRIAQRSCERQAGRYPLYTTMRDWRQQCERRRGWEYDYLSMLALQRGDARQSLVEADSAIAATRQWESCGSTRAHLNHGLASLALGDTTTAETDFVKWAAHYPPSAAITILTVRTHLGPRFNERRWLARSDSAHRTAMACEQAQRAAAKSRRPRGGI